MVGSNAGLERAELARGRFRSTEPGFAEPRRTAANSLVLDARDGVRRKRRGCARQRLHFGKAATVGDALKHVVRESIHARIGVCPGVAQLLGLEWAEHRLGLG